jgi:hypothetical protein
LTGIGEFDQAARVDGWTEAVINLLGDAHRWVGAWRRDGHDRLPDFTVEDLSSWRYDELVARALNVHPARGGKQAPARNAALRLQKHKDEFLRFTTDFTVGFTNNTAEQAIRMIKVKTKVSGGFRTLTGAQTFLALRGYISTVRTNVPPLLVGPPGGCWGCSCPSRRRRPLMAAYDGPQVVGMDLHRRRSVLVRMTPEGEKLAKVRIANSPERLSAEIAKAGPAPEVVLEATYG